MFSNQLLEWIEQGYQDAMRFLETIADSKFAAMVEQATESTTGDVRAVMKYYFSAMPYSDLADTDFGLLVKYAEHAVFLRQEIPWCREIPEKTFLMDVAAYRINNEKIMDCRRMFFDELWERVKGLSMQDAVLETNYWCAEHATYHLADSRTASALTVYRSGFGRCGEESVFTVTALRSIGIPARQVYTPLWAHCDDNHAWVEAWCDGEWYFLGACEPEEVLNKGWFTGPASRAMLLHAKYFTSLPLPEAEFTEGFVRYVNRISMYAHPTMLTVEVTDKDGRPLPDATVHFELLNGSEYGGIATKPTDADGRVTIELGKGSIRVHVVKDGLYAEKDVPATDGLVRMTLDGSQDLPADWKEYWLTAPDFAAIHPGYVTGQQKARNKERMTAADKMRLERVSSYYSEERAAKYPALEKQLKDSAANFDELLRFLERDDNPYRVKMIEVLSVKDMYDLNADVLEEHLQEAMAFTGTYPDDIFEKFLLNPRVVNEELSCYRRFIKEYFTPEQLAEFTAHPETILEYIESHISYDESRDFERLRVSPKGALEMKFADPVSRRVLFCAICRTLGIPARVNWMTREAAYYRDGDFVEVKAAVSKHETAKAQADLTMVFEEGTEWHYFRNWTLSAEKDGLFHPMGLFHIPMDGNQMKLSLAEGIYRFIASTRTPDGNQFVRELTFALSAGENRTVEVIKPRPETQIQRINKTIDSVMAYDADGTKKTVEEITPGERQMVLWLDPGKEPTQHVLNELLDSKDVCRRLGERIVVLTQDKAAQTEPLIEKVMGQIANLSYMTAEQWELSEQIAQELNLQPYQYPLVYVRDEKKHIIYADCGYNVGSVDLMLKLLEEK